MWTGGRAMRRSSEDLINYIKNTRMYLKSIRYEYQHQNRAINKKPQGTFDYALSESYYATIRNHLEQLENIIRRLSETIDSNFKVDVKVLPNGTFDFEHLHIQITRSFATRDSRGVYHSQIELLYNTLYNILVFADCINDVHLYSTNHHLSHCEVFLCTSLEDVIYMIENVSVPDKCFHQWMYAIREFEKFSKTHYACSLNIPCEEGELSFENSVFGLSQREFISR